ncbi:putative universal stress protein [bacterium BMS3Abin03]|nr:putative universal stress protein [bacterium BMS3Abin03]
MFKIKNILLPTDFSSRSKAAVEYAIELADQYKAKLHVLHVLEKTPPVLAIRSFDLSEEKILESINQEAQKSLDKTVEEIKNKAAVQIVPVIKKGIDFEEIVNYSEKEEIDIIVIATHGRTGLMHTLIGSVAEKVIRHAKCPVLVITPAHKDE